MVSRHGGLVCACSVRILSVGVGGRTPNIDRIAKEGALFGVSRKHAAFRLGGPPRFIFSGRAGYYDIRIKNPNLSEPDLRRTHLIWSEIYRKATERRGPHSWLRHFSCNLRFPADSPSVDLAPSRAYCRHECQRPGGTNAVHRDVVRAGIRHVGKLARRMYGNRGRRQPRRYHTYQC